MATKKKLGPTEHTTVEPREPMPIVDVIPMVNKPFAHVPETMPCPVPGHNGKAEIVHTETRDYAVCHCPGASKHYGQVVWEKLR
jgi:hypothetical protein